MTFVKRGNRYQNNIVYVTKKYVKYKKKLSYIPLCVWHTNIYMPVIFMKI